jgi:hypothetical protein
MKRSSKSLDLPIKILFDHGLSLIQRTSHELKWIIFSIKIDNSAQTSSISPRFRHTWTCLLLPVIMPCDNVFCSIYVALNQARKEWKGWLAGALNLFIIRLFLIGPKYLLIIGEKMNTIFVCVRILLPFHFTIHYPIFMWVRWLKLYTFKTLMVNTYSPSQSKSEEHNHSREPPLLMQTFLFGLSCL